MPANSARNADSRAALKRRLKRMPVDSKYKILEDLKDDLRHQNAEWDKRGWTKTKAPAARIREAKKTEKLFLSVLESMDFPPAYWGYTGDVLVSATEIIEEDEEIKTASKDWKKLSPDAQADILQKIADITSVAQSLHARIRIDSGTVSWFCKAKSKAGGVRYGDALVYPGVWRDSYGIRLNAHKASGLRKDFAHAARIVIHEQIHIAQRHIANAARRKKFSASSHFFKAGRIFLAEKKYDAYVEADDSRFYRLYESQPSEHEAWVMTDLLAQYPLFGKMPARFKKPEI